jgi:hypothetical protein
MYVAGEFENKMAIYNEDVSWYNIIKG